MKSKNALYQKKAFLAFSALVLAIVITSAQLFLIKPSSIGDVDQFRLELSGLTPKAASSSWIDGWMWGQTAPFKYRILGRLLIWSGYKVIGGVVPDISAENALYYSSIANQFILLAATLYALGMFTRKLAGQLLSGMDEEAGYLLAIGSILIFSLSPSILFFTKFPVHGTSNDLLGYLLTLAALYSLLEKKLLVFCAVATIGVFCRETTLLTPFIFLFFYRYPLFKKMVVVSIPLFVFVVYRIAWPGTYDPLVGNRINIAKPLETIIFAFLIFGPLWITGLLGYFRCNARIAEQAAARWFVTSFPWAILLVSIITFLFSNLREIRIPFMLFFYFVPFSVIWIYENRNQIKNLLRKKFFVLYIIASIVVVFRLWLWMVPATTEELMALRDSIGTVLTGYMVRMQIGDIQIYGPIPSRYDNWTAIVAFYLFLFLTSLPFLLIVKLPKIRNKTSTKKIGD